MKLKKGSSIKLEKDSDKLNEITIGCSWKTKSQSIDVDTMVFKVNNNLITDSIYYGSKTSQGIIHFGDDTTGNNKQHESDNEVIFLELNKIKGVNAIPVFIDSYTGHNLLSDVYDLKIRVYSGKPGDIQEILGEFEVQPNKNIKNNNLKAYSIFIGEFVYDGTWTFNSVGTYTIANRLSQIQKYIQSNTQEKDFYNVSIEENNINSNNINTESLKVDTKQSLLNKIKNIFK